MKLVEENIEFLWDKYGKIFTFINIIHEFYFLITGKMLMRDTDHIIINRYIKLIKKCKEDITKIDNCKEICSELGLNKFSYMWDGEP